MSKKIDLWNSLLVIICVLLCSSVSFGSPASSAVDHIVNAEARGFKPDTVYIAPGDTVKFTNMTSHNSVSVEGLIPEGAKPWRSKLGEAVKLTLDIEGVYAYVCEPHIGFGMVGLIIVGEPSNLEQVTEYALKKLKGPYRRLIGKIKKKKVPTATLR